MPARGREGNGFPTPREADPMPSPEIGLVFAPFPPLMKMPSGPRPPPPPLASPGAPGCDPSGEIEMRAERFPAGIAGGGATGAGVAERAISAPLSTLRPAISGAAAFVTLFCGAACGADIGLTGRTGFGGACADEAVLMAPASLSGTATSGAATSEAARGAGVLGRMAASCSTVSCNFGRTGWDLARLTILGSAGKI